MRLENRSTVTEFIFLGFAKTSQLEIILFVVILLLFLLILTGNFAIIVITRIDPRLHTPMYFFLSSLSFSETCYTLVVIPNMLANFFIERKAISFIGCAVQLYCFIALANNNCFLLVAMGYDRYVAICNPLRYVVIMNRRVCNQLTLIFFLVSLLLSVLPTTVLFTLTFCGSNQIDHFFCGGPAVLKLSCNDTRLVEAALFMYSFLAIAASLIFIFVSYVFIVSTILRIPSAEGRQKAFSTCASHLTVVILHFGCASFTYLQPQRSQSTDQDKLISLSYLVVTPLLNPLVYSIRNKDVRNAFKKALSNKGCSQRK
ncbi:LOW QUALITY PROTEIN: olfactory receptor 10Z1-like [Rhinatrema bivittatum]|uniref:olfactory receptor 10Z1-like n=1 Tax=Rhinatrema bivittatum TaxID=194408 RepID=UPI00112E6DF0|nr:olfactory receptor 10Z1-like [Rhinatrema bivittatum]XP_029441721.1 LOW QUALITY PROTEIN: olfactory receptor 10Z1-like [Rhinatrema bivittatum]